jgi:hypothetical protein
LSQARSVTEPPPADDREGVERPFSVGGEGLVHRGADRGRGVDALERRPEVNELAQPGVVEPVGLAAEVAQPRRGLGADDGDPDVLDRGGEPPVAVVEVFGDEAFTDPGELGREVAEGVRGVDVLDAQVEPEVRVEPDRGQAEDLDVDLEAFACRLKELGGDPFGPAPPDDRPALGDHVASFVPLGQVEVEVAVLAA